MIQAETGGEFGGKEEYPSMLAGHATLLAMKSGKPVKMIYDRAEDMVATTKRHPSRTRHRTGVTRDGKLVAMDIDFVIDGGAYATLSSVVLSRGTIHAAGPYFCPNVRVQSRAVATNAPPMGRFADSARRKAFSRVERHLDQVARAVNLTPDEFRRRNFIRKGQTTATGQLISEGVNLTRSSIARSGRATTTLSATASRVKIPARRSSAAWGLPPSCTEQASPARERLPGVRGGTRSDAGRKRPRACGRRLKSAREPIRYFRKLRRMRSASATIESKIAQPGYEIAVPTAARPLLAHLDGRRQPGGGCRA